MSLASYRTPPLPPLDGSRRSPFCRGPLLLICPAMRRQLDGGAYPYIEPEHNASRATIRQRRMGLAQEKMAHCAHVWSVRATGATQSSHARPRRQSTAWVSRGGG